MRVELTEHPKGNKRFEISLGDTCYVIDLERAKELADEIYKLHPTAKSENEALYILRDVVDWSTKPHRERYQEGTMKCELCEAWDKYIALLETD